MGFKDSTNRTESSAILPFPVKNRQWQLSIPIDDADIGNFYDEYYSMVKDRCYAVLHNEQEAQDSAQDIFEKLLVLKSEGRLHITYPKTFLSKVATNMGINKKKQARRELNKIYDIATNGSLEWFKNSGKKGREVWEIGIADNGYDQVEAHIIVQAILDEQDETTRKIYFYRFHDNMSLEQIGEILGLGTSTIHKKIKALTEQVKVKMGAGK